MEFKDLVFKENRGGQQAKVFFDNGFGASVIVGSLARSTPDKPYELAVIKGCEDDWDICYATRITEDTEGYLAERDVSILLGRIEVLESCSSYKGQFDTADSSGVFAPTDDDKYIVSLMSESSQ